MAFKLKNKLATHLGLIEPPSIINFSKSLGIPAFVVKSVNDKFFLEELRKLNPDVIINQSQNILKKEFLEIAKIGVINRHNALLPKNRGRLTPFWVLHKREKETGVSIHFVTESIDAGKIIVQEKFPVSKRETFSSLVKKNYEVAPKAMLKALELLERGDYQTIENDDRQATYNTIPTFKDALSFRLSRMRIT